MELGRIEAKTSSFSSPPHSFEGFISMKMMSCSIGEKPLPVEAQATFSTRYMVLTEEFSSQIVKKSQKIDFFTL
jgi:hypothetical protein